MYEKKRFLVKTVFETAKNELHRGNKSSISSYLSSLFEDRYDFRKDERSYNRYYTKLVEENTDYNIDDLTLYYLSKYIGYDNFEDFRDRVDLGSDDSKTFSLSFKEISEKLQQIIITVSPTVLLPDFIKKNGLGIVEMAFVLLLVTGGVVFSNGKGGPPLGIFSGGGTPAIDKPYMYWDKDRYIASDSGYINPQTKVVPMDPNRFVYQKKITRPDTLTIENGDHKVWYDKTNNHVEFFTNYGMHPENGKALKIATGHIIETYGGENAVLELADN
ncbi:hypothetical protein [uncultured Chryseobacterium sp.]|uniref:hypothetical protein n=1 Tax=uncultured Chryseobacterium sp. TaxID=259322 RepID=UPI0025FBCA0E|nr:hypothetical protein [uncultured Chryseobacterium sp.]